MPLLNKLTYNVGPTAEEKEIITSWSLFILIVLLIIALFVAYVLQARRIQAVHETVISIFAGSSVSKRHATYTN